MRMGGQLAALVIAQLGGSDKPHAASQSVANMANTLRASVLSPRFAGYEAIG